MMGAIDLINLRSELKISQLTMASRIGLSIRSLQNIESGKARLRRLHALAIERVLINYAIERNDPAILGHLRKDLTTLIMLEFTARLGGAVTASSTRPTERLQIVHRAR